MARAVTDAVVLQSVQDRRERRHRGTRDVLWMPGERRGLAWLRFMDDLLDASRRVQRAEMSFF